MELTRRVEISLGLAVVALITAGCLLVVAPFVSSILWAAIICFATWPIHQRTERLCGRNRALAAAVMTTLLVVLTVLPFILSASPLEKSISAFFAWLRNARANGLPMPPEWINRIPIGGEYLQSYWADLAADSERTRIYIMEFQRWLLVFSKNFAVGLLHLCISMLIAFFFYRDGDRLVDRIAEVGNRVLGSYTQHLVLVVGRTVRGVVYGFLGTAMVQGMLAAIGFAIVQAPGALLLGLLTFFLALVPFGPPLVWIPVTIWLAMQGSIGLAIFMALWGLIAISGIDHVLRPYLISREAQLPFVLVFLGALGGVLSFGFIGLFLGPTLLAVGYALLHEFLIHKDLGAEQ